jgi:RNA polymerase sigma-70 factor (ECF subfamily)
VDPLAPSAAITARATVLAVLRERIVAFAASRYARESAEDLAQEVLVVLHEKYGHLERMEDLVPLSFQILRFKLAAARRKALRRGEHSAMEADLLASPDPDPEAQADARQRLERLAAALSRLGGRCREIFRLKLQGKGFAEIQALMGAATLNTLYTWDHRCRKQLLEEMGGRWEP